MASSRAPKQWSLTVNEKINTVEVWKQNLIYILSLDKRFTSFIQPDSSWGKKTSTNPNRGFTDDGEDVDEDLRRTATQKCAELELMLGQIANFCPIIARNSLIKQSTSLEDIWQKIRQHFGFQSTGAHFLDLADIKLEPNERHEDLYQRIMSFFEDNLLTQGCGILHNGSHVETDEDMSPTLENTVILMWLQLVHKGLPSLVKQRYGPELRNKTLASLKPEISQALPSLLDELRTIEDSRVSRTNVTFPPRRPAPTRRKTDKECSICKAAGRPGASSHFLSECRLLTESDRRFLRAGRSRMVGDGDLSDDDLENDNTGATFEDSAFIDPIHSSVRRVDVVESPVLNCFYNEHPVKLTLDTGATTNLVTLDFAKSVDLPVKPTSQSAYQADGVTPLDVVGEVHCSLTRGETVLWLDALVVRKLDTPVLVGNPFHVSNDIGTRPKKRQIIIGGSDVVYYGPQSTNKASIRRAQATVLRTPAKSTVLLPGDHIEFHTPLDTDPDTEWALEPRLDCPSNQFKPNSPWPEPQVIQSVNHTIRLRNDTDEPIKLKRNEHVCQIRSVVPAHDHPSEPIPVSTHRPNTASPKGSNHSSPIVIDPENTLASDMKQKFKDLHATYDSVFSPDVPKYNGASGPIEATVNMGPTLPPQRKGRLPSYNRDSLIDLQNKFDDLERQGVFAKPEDVNVSVEYLNLSFLVKKPNGGTRLVTSFGEVGQYAKPQPALMPNVDQVLRNISSWKYIIHTDLRQSFYQIPLSHSAMKYCGVVTPFKGVRVYTRSAMGMPGSETALEELMTRILGEFVMEGWCAKLADDLYIGGDTPDELFHHWSVCLSTIHKNNLGLNPSKTVIAPVSATILGWIWKNGTLHASPHRISALSSVDPPGTVQSLRSFIGAYKVLSRVLKGYAMLLDPLEKLTSGKQSRDKIDWSEPSLHAFRLAQQSLDQCQTITMPIPSDRLWIVTDASVAKGGAAATLYVCRGDKVLLAGFFNAKLKDFQRKWLPCEVEGLCIASAVQHFAPYITHSLHQAQILTDSKPCVQAYHKLMRGEFSTSARITSFLSCVSRYNMEVRHISGVANLPSDYTSRNPTDCPNHTCQICHFVEDLQLSVVRNVSVQDVMAGSVRMPFSNRVAWQATQQECQDLRRVHSHLSQGTRPGKKAVKVRDVRRYLHDVVISNDGLLVVKDNQPFQPPRERIVVPRSVLDGLVTAVHIRFNHPSPFQMKQLLSRYFYALNLDAATHTAYDTCHHCMALKSVPASLQTQSTEDPPTTIGSSFALDVMRRYRQCVLLLRETVSSFTLTSIIADEKHETLRDAIITMCADVALQGESGVQVRVDPGPGLVALKDDPVLLARGIHLVVGRVKNPNKNPVAERAIEELGLEFLKTSPGGGPITTLSLAMATSSMNSRIRRDGLSAREIWTQRDQVTGQQLPIEDRQIIIKQHFDRVYAHGPSAHAKSGDSQRSCDGGPPQVGDLVYITRDKDKTKARERYLVVDVEDNRCRVRKFVNDQFRSKTYDLRLSDIYPIRSNVLGTHPLSSSLPHRNPEVKEKEPVTLPYLPHTHSPFPAVSPPPEIVAPEPPEIVGHEIPETWVPESPPTPLVEIPTTPPTPTSPHRNTQTRPPPMPDPCNPPTPTRPTRSKVVPVWHADYVFD